MPDFQWPDLSSLASLARTQDLDLRPVLLRVHADLFIAAPSRDKETVRTFEALALGFLPLVDTATAAIVAHKLAPFPETPPRVLDALMRRGGEVRAAVLAGTPMASERGEPVADANLRRLRLLSRGRELSPADVSELLSARDEAIDLALARNVEAPLVPSELQQLAERGRNRSDLALALLERELGPGEEAILYLHADRTRRAQIRVRLEPVVALSATSYVPRASQNSVDLLVGAAMARDMPAFETELAGLLGLSVMPAWSFHSEERRELLALALVAAGVPDESCIRIFLTLDRTVACSVQAVFRLAQTVRTVSRPLATYLVEASLGVTIAAGRPARHAPVIGPQAAASRSNTAHVVSRQATPQERRTG
jgi:hypothetical protein